MLCIATGAVRRLRAYANLQHAKTAQETTMFGKLFSGIFGGGNAEKPSKEGEAVEYRGYLISPQCEDVGGQFRVSGWIRKPGAADSAMREHRFERSDVMPA